MNMLRELFWAWDRPLGRREYAFTGCLLVIGKLWMDYWIVHQMFGQKWSPASYLLHTLGLPPELDVATSAPVLFSVCLASLPFAWVALHLTTRRLLAAGFPVWLSVLCGVPSLNLALFAVLCFVPTRGNSRKGPQARKNLLPKSLTGSALFSAALASVFGLLLLMAGTTLWQSYGLSIFFAIPIAVPVIACLIHGTDRELTLSECSAVSFYAVFLSLLGMLVFAIEGVVCLVMASPLLGAEAFVGAMIGYSLNLLVNEAAGRQAMCHTLLLALPLFIWADAHATNRPPLREATTSVTINASPQTVWKHVVSFRELPPPDEFAFKYGISYPVRATIQGKGVGAVRYCVFSTGSFVEPITVWDEPRLLRFAVTKCPPPLTELSPYRIHPPHLDNFLVSRQGQFSLEEIAPGKTRLTGTTWYTHEIEPQWYWSHWSDNLIHSIHRRVLSHIKNEAEAVKT